MGGRGGLDKGVPLLNFQKIFPLGANRSSASRELAAKHIIVSTPLVLDLLYSGRSLCKTFKQELSTSYLQANEVQNIFIC